MRERLSVPGLAGRLEADWLQPDTASMPGGLAIICHPHPLYGGTMDNKVVTTLQRAACDAGLSALRFNFRGVGASEGQFEQGDGETEDALAVLDWALAQTGLRQFALLGFSFGGMVAVRVATQRRPAQLVTVAPALHDMAANQPRLPACPWLLIHGRDDEVVDCAEIQARVKDREPPVDLRLLDGVGHFYHGRLGDLRQIVTPVLLTRWTELAVA